MTEPMKNESAGLRRSRVTLIGLAALFILPVLLAWLIYLNPQWLKGGETSNYGELMTPARPVPELPMKTLDGEDYDLAGRKDRWTLLQVVPAACDALCSESLYKGRQVRLTLARDMKRVRRVVLLTGEQALDAELLSEHADTLVVRTSPQQREAIDELLLPNDGVAVPVDGRIYIIDPLGNLMMAYPPEFDMKGLQKDLKRLLKASYVG